MFWITSSFFLVYMTYMPFISITWLYEHIANNPFAGLHVILTSSMVSDSFLSFMSIVVVVNWFFFTLLTAGSCHNDKCQWPEPFFLSLSHIQYPFGCRLDSDEIGSEWWLDRTKPQKVVCFYSMWWSFLLRFVGSKRTVIIIIFMMMMMMMTMVIGCVCLLMHRLVLP